MLCSSLYHYKHKYHPKSNFWFSNHKNDCALVTNSNQCWNVLIYSKLNLYNYLENIYNVVFSFYSYNNWLPCHSNCRDNCTHLDINKLRHFESSDQCFVELTWCHMHQGSEQLLTKNRDLYFYSNCMWCNKVWDRPNSYDHRSFDFDWLGYRYWLHKDDSSRPENLSLDFCS